jgi:hypothetical protein
MYGHLRDLFIEILKYPPSDVDIDRRGARGRPDVTVFAPSGVDNAKVSWIVVEAKDERDLVADPNARAALFAEKAKYITADTAWFMMADPTAIVARPAHMGADASADITAELKDLSIEQFAERFGELHADNAGVPIQLARFRAGDETTIGTEKLSGLHLDPLKLRIARNAFFDGLAGTTHQLQLAVRTACRFPSRTDPGFPLRTDPA